MSAARAGLATIQLLVSLLGLAAAASAQESKPPAFPAAAEVVRLDLAVHDARGRIVRDLRADEVQVFEEGKPCTISSFRLVRRGTGGGFDARGDGGRRPATRGPRRAASRRPAWSPWCSTCWTSDAAQRARQAALDMVGRQFPAGTWFTVFKVGAGLRILQPLTTDPATLPDAITRATPGDARPREVSRNPGLDSATEDALSAALAAAETLPRPPSFGGRSLVTDSAEQGMAAAQIQMLQAQAQMLLFTNALSREQRSQVTLYPLLALARSLSSLEGRKTILFFSQGLHMTSSLWEVLLSTISEVNRANATVYAFDAGGLGVESPVKTTKAALEVARLISVSGGDLHPGGRAGGRGPVHERPGQPAEPGREHGRLPRGQYERSPPGARARGRRPPLVLRDRVRSPEPQARRPLARDQGEGDAARPARPRAQGLFRHAGGQAGGAPFRAAPPDRSRPEPASPPARAAGGDGDRGRDGARSRHARPRRGPRLGGDVHGARLGRGPDRSRPGVADGPRAGRERPSRHEADPRRAVRRARARRAAHATSDARRPAHADALPRTLHARGLGHRPRVGPARSPPRSLRGAVGRRPRAGRARRRAPAARARGRGRRRPAARGRPARRSADGRPGRGRRRR